MLSNHDHDKEESIIPSNAAADVTDNVQAHEGITHQPSQNSTSPSPRPPQKSSRRFDHDEEAYVMYAVPRQAQQWGEHQVLPEDLWGQLLFDLIFVGTGSQLSLCLRTGFENGDPATGFGIFAAMYFAVMQLWDAKLFYFSRFRAEDLSHRLYQIVMGVVVVIAACSISDVQTMSQPYSFNAAVFSGAILIFSILDMGLSFEVAWFGKSRGAMGQGRLSILLNLLPLIIMAAALALVLTGQPIAGPAVLWGCYGLLGRLQILLLVRFKLFPSKQNTVPMNIVFSIHRKGEWVMLMLGECVISLVVSGIDPSATYLVCVALSFVLIAVITMLHFAAYPSDPNENALRRSSVRALILTYVESLLGMSILMTGAGFDMALAYVAKVEALGGNYTPTQQDLAVYWFYSASIAGALLMILIARLLHHGPWEEFVHQTAERRRVKLGVWAAKLCCIAFVILVPLMTITAWVAFLLVDIASSVLFTIQVVDHRWFREHHLGIIRNEVKRRKKEHREMNLEVITKHNSERRKLSSHADDISEDEVVVAAVAPATAQVSQNNSP